MLIPISNTTRLYTSSVLSAWGRRVVGGCLLVGRCAMTSLGFWISGDASVQSRSGELFSIGKHNDLLPNIEANNPPSPPRPPPRLFLHDGLQLPPSRTRSISTIHHTTTTCEEHNVH